MHVHTKIQKWGNGLGLRVSGILRDLPQLKVGAEVDIEVTPDGFSVKKVIKLKRKLKLPYTEAQLLAGLSAETVHRDLLIKPLASEMYD